ncbi:hypothetical protein [Virgibacillus dokdonensis]|uniref:hypothetical protein n=1 Tax=Virgibacillus dokdonensis TaxID=302167 RepID=UPI00098AB16E|nr:hypothetical protein [Virgibacillus dokdonensis]
MLKKFFPVLCVVAVVLGLSFPISSHASEVNYGENEKPIDWKYGTDVIVDKNQVQMAEQLSTYFEENTDGTVDFNAVKETLMDIGISENDAELMASINSDDLSFNEEKQEQQIQGFVGFYLKLGPKVRAMNAIVAGAFAAVITASTAGVVGWVVKNKLKKVNVGINIARVSLS